MTKYVLMSGITDNARISAQLGVPFLGKPYSLNELYESVFGDAHINGTGYKIAVVEDDVFQRRFLKRSIDTAIKKRGICGDVRVFEKGDEFIEACKSGYVPDVALIDFNGLGMNGDQVIEQHRKLNDSGE